MFTYLYYIRDSGRSVQAADMACGEAARNPMGITATSPGPVNTPVMAAASVAAAVVLMTQCAYAPFCMGCTAGALDEVLADVLATVNTAVVPPVMLHVPV